MSASGIEISYDAPPAVRAALERTARTEGARFSPNNRQLALADFNRNSIAIIAVDITIGGDRPHVTLTDVTELSSPCLNNPHGVEYLDDETIIVANRGGHVNVFRLPSDMSAVDRAELTPIDPPPGHGFELINEPGSLVIAGDADGGIEVLICNNAGETVTRHTLQDDPLAVTTSDVLLRRSLAVPDGVTVSRDNRWIAISNHDAHIVMLYKRSSSLHESSAPDGILRGTSYPHGLCFSADARHLFAADAGMPYVHVYAREGQSWKGLQYPAASLRVMDDEVFQRGRYGPQEGGPKGLDIDRDGNVLAVTSEHQPLAFFDVSAMLEHCTGRCGDHALRVIYELEIVEQARAAEAHIAALEGSRSFRWTRPLRRLKAIWLRLRR
jgi:hypothetical protein